MSIRVDTASLISGALVCGGRGLGVLPADIPSTGDDGASILYNDIESGDEAKEFRALILTVPSGGAVFFYEDGSFIASGFADGEHSGTYRLFVDGADLGTATYTFTVGASGTAVTGTLAATLDGVTMVASGQISVAGLFASTLDGVTLSASGAVAEHATGTFAATLGDVRMRASGYLGDTPPSGGFWRRISIGLGIGL